jgi:prolipoprotein diacylglyceryl transferase
MALPLYIPSPPANGFHIGPAYIHFYGLMYVVGITLAILITQRRWKAQGGESALVGDVAIWAVPAGIVGGRIYFDLTTPKYIPHHWYGVFAVWDGGLGIWGGVALAAVVGVWRVRRAGADVGRFMDAVAPALLVAQGIGRIGNYFNEELFGGPTRLPWGLEITPAFRPAGYAGDVTFHPTFLYELIFDLLLAAFLVWLGHHRSIRPPGLFALYVTGYSAFRIFEESLRVDPSEHFLGLRLNFYVASALTIAGIAWFVHTQRRGPAVASGVAPEGVSEPEAGHPGTPATEDQDTTGTLSQDATGTAREDTTGTLSQDTTGTAREDTTGTLSQDTTGTAREDTTGTLSQDATGDDSETSPRDGSEAEPSRGDQARQH